MNALIQELMMSSCQRLTNGFEGNTHTANTINRPNIINTSLQELDNNARISTTNKWDNSNIYPLVSGLLWLQREKLLYRTILNPKGSQRDNLLKCMEALLLG